MLSCVTKCRPGSGAGDDDPPMGGAFTNILAGQFSLTRIGRLAREGAFREANGQRSLHETRTCGITATSAVSLGDRTEETPGSMSRTPHRHSVPGPRFTSNGAGGIRQMVVVRGDAVLSRKLGTETQTSSSHIFRVRPI